MAGSIGEEVGRALRRARLARGLTLKEVGVRSGGSFTPTAVAGYERAERTISIVRFYALCAFYDVAPAGVLAEIAEEVDGRVDRVIDLTPLEDTAASADGRSTS